jgi:hypothetical protein
VHSVLPVHLMLHWHSMPCMYPCTFAYLVQGLLFFKKGLKLLYK